MSSQLSTKSKHIPESLVFEQEKAKMILLILVLAFALVIDKIMMASNDFRTTGIINKT